MLLKRAERLMFYAETIVERAGADDDYRLQLQAIDRVKSSLELVMRAVGMIGPDVQVTVDNRQVNLYAAWSTSALEALQTFHDELGAGKSVQDACTAILAQDSTKPRALHPGRSEDAA
jgi:hypothetical protein